MKIFRYLNQPLEHFLIFLIIGESTSHFSDADFKIGYMGKQKMSQKIQAVIHMYISLEYTHLFFIEKVTFSLERENCNRLYHWFFNVFLFLTGFDWVSWKKL